MKTKDGRSDVHPLHHFHPWQVWPGSYDNPKTSAYPLPNIDRPVIGKNTAIAGIGSCIIREMLTRLQGAGYSVLTEEADKPGGVHASAAWERLYNLFSIRQVLEYALTGTTPQPRWWISAQTGMVQDPYRRIVLYDTMEEAETDFSDHCRTARRVLTTAEVLLISLDYVEIWEDKGTGAVICLPSGPYFIEGGDLGRYRFRVSRYEENLQALSDIHGLLRAHNPACRIILILSPIQQWATFREDADIFSAGFNAKATLKAAADAFTAANPDVSYFPAYEIAMLYRQTQNAPIFAQGRENFHVNAATCDTILAEFIRWYGREQP
jgi:hypothetical protein